MFRIITALTLSSCMGMSAAFAGESFGSFAKQPTPQKPLTAAIAAQDKNLLQIEGRVQKVCEKKGCWMTLEDQGVSVRVVFKDYSFFVPLKLVGQRVRAEGRLHAKEMTVAMQQHLLQDAGASAADIAAVKSPKMEYEFEAQAVQVL